MDTDRSASADLHAWKERRWVRIMCDFAADAVWNIDGESCDVEDLPISAPLAARLRAWQTHYDQFAPTDNLVSVQWDVAAFSDEGRELARAVKTELPGWHVVYFDQFRAGAVNVESESQRSLYEYEITL